MEDLVYKSATHLANLIQEREISSKELVNAYLSQIQKYNAKVNAIVTLNDDGALEQAEIADRSLHKGTVYGPLHGVPITVKDSFATAGIKTTASSKQLEDYVPETDATVVARLKAAGAIVLGKTNAPMMAMDVQTENSMFGRSNNPWDLNRVTGGSSGGGAVAVASGFSALEMGSDLGGSIRVPAHYCGVYGFKPTEHLVPDTGQIPPMPGVPRGVHHMETPGIMARSVSDLRLALSVIMGPDGRESDVAPVRLKNSTQLNMKKFKIAWWDRFDGVPISTETRLALESFVQQLKEVGCTVSYCRPDDFIMVDAWRCWGEILGAEIGSSMPWMPRVLESMGFRIQQRGRSLIKMSVLKGFKMRMPSYALALGKRDQFIEKMDSFFNTWDAWICPVSPTPAFTHCRTGKPIDVDNINLPYLEALVSYASIFSLTGSPVVTMPVTQTSDGLPIGFQLVGKRWEDLKVLAIAEAISKILIPLPQRPAGLDTQ